MCAYRPVKIADRLGQHIGDVVNYKKIIQIKKKYWNHQKTLLTAFLKITPLEVTNFSMFFNGSREFSIKSWSSVRKIIKLNLPKTRLDKNIKNDNAIKWICILLFSKYIFSCITLKIFYDLRLYEIFVNIVEKFIGWLNLLANVFKQKINN